MTTTERTPLPPVVCASWCVHGDGHPDELFRGDQTCWGDATYVDLSLEEVTRDGSESWLVVPRVGIMAYRRWSRTPCVYVHLDDIQVPMGRGRTEWLDHALHLTADEALGLAEALRSAAEEIGGNQTKP